MSTITWRILILVALFIYMLFMVPYCNRNYDECCEGTSGQEEAAVVPDDDDTAVVDTVNRYPLAFKWADATPFEGPGFADYKAKLMAANTGSNILEITGFYSEGETAPEGYDNMGFYRAELLRQKYFADIPKERIRLRARAVDAKEGAQQGAFFEAAAFNWLDAEKPAKKIEELDDRIIIRFPSNSTVKEPDATIDAYLEKLAARVKETGERVALTGHTDNTNTEAYNMELGRGRATAVQQILINKGVDAAQITTASKGESQPTDTNATAQGRRNNRRVEVRLIKNN